MTLTDGVAGAAPMLPDAAQVNQWLSQPRKTRGLDDRALGLMPSSEAALREVPRFRVVPAMRGERPERVVLTEFLPPVGQQGVQGSCAAWASTYYSYTYAVARQQGKSREDLAKPENQYSPAYTYNLSPHGPDDKGGGMQFADAFRALRTRGAATMEAMPYDESNSATTPSEDTVTAAKRLLARRVGVLYEGSLRRQPLDLEKVKTFLADAQLPIVTGIPVFRDFQDLRHVEPNFVYTPSNPSKENLIGLHAITIIGYDDTKHAFRMVNSWGTDWGDNGFLWLHEDFLKTLSLEGWTQVAGGFVVRDPNSPPPPKPVFVSGRVTLMPVVKPVVKPAAKSTKKPTGNPVTARTPAKHP